MTHPRTTLNAVDPGDSSSLEVRGHAPPPSLLRNRNFLLLWAAYGISAFGDHLSELGLMRELRVEHSARQVQTQALMTFLFFLPYFLGGWFTGTVADRLPRRLVMITADLARAAIVLALPWWVEWQVRATGADLELRDLVVALLPLLGLGLFAAFFSPARLALLPQLVHPDQLTRANSVTSGLGTIAALASNVVGGVLAQIRPLINFVADACTFALSAVCATAIRAPAGSAPRGTGPSFLGTVNQGLRYVRTHRRVVEFILLAALFWTGAGVFSSVLPSVVFSRYDLDYAWLGAMRGTLAAGMLLGAASLAWFGNAVRGEFVNLLALVGAGVALLLFAWASWVAAGLFLGLLVGATGAWLLISVNTMLQRIVPNRWRGRIFGIADMATIAGLLAATGVLGLTPIRGLDRAVPHILAGLGVVMIAAGLVMHLVLARRAGMNPVDLCIWRLNEVYCKWWFRCRRIGPCRVPRDGGAILAANHTSYIDPLLLHATGNYRKIGFVVAHEYYFPVIRRLLNRLGCIAVTRSGQDTAATRAAVRHLQSGHLLGIFPQGGIETAESPRDAKSGVALLALRAGVPVVPVHISGTHYHEGILRTFLRRHHAVIRYGEPISPAQFASLARMPDGQAVPEKQLRQRATELIMERIRALTRQDSADA